MRTAGAALLPVYEMPSGGEPSPQGETACHIASFAAKAAEWAARAAQEDVAGSANAALEAYTFARDAADAAEADDVLAQLHSDFAALYRVASRGCWADSTPVRPSVFDLLAEDGSDKRWWKFWR